MYENKPRYGALSRWGHSHTIRINMACEDTTCDPKGQGFSGMLLALHATQAMGRVGGVAFLLLAHM